MEEKRLKLLIGIESEEKSELLLTEELVGLIKSPGLSKALESNQEVNINIPAQHKGKVTLFFNHHKKESKLNGSISGNDPSDGQPIGVKSLIKLMYEQADCLQAMAELEQQHEMPLLRELIGHILAFQIQNKTAEQAREYLGLENDYTPEQTLEVKRVVRSLALFA